jgi:hypothetical protein
MIALSVSSIHHKMPWRMVEDMMLSRATDREVGIQHATYNLQRTTCNVQHARCNVECRGLLVEETMLSRATPRCFPLRLLPAACPRATEPHSATTMGDTLVRARPRHHLVRQHARRLRRVDAVHRRCGGGSALSQSWPNILWNTPADKLPFVIHYCQAYEVRWRL